MNMGEFGPLDMRNHPIVPAMQCAVPLHILSLKQRGGPTNEDFVECKKTSDMLGADGDLLIYGQRKNSKEGDTARLFNRTAKAIAVLSFCPGGINIFGSHFEAKDILVGLEKRKKIIKLIKRFEKKTGKITLIKRNK